MSNAFETKPAKFNDIEYYDIIVDGKPLHQHFVGRQGAHPSWISPLGWKSAASKYKVELIDQFLGNQKQELASGRTPVLVCENCGDLGCGAIAARISIEGGGVKWHDWAQENGYEDPSELSWPTKPTSFEFELSSYKEQLLKTK